MPTILDRDMPECPVRIASTPPNSDDDPFNMRKLSAFVKASRKQDFWLELAIWDRIYYKNVNQHRQSHYFKKFGEVRRLMKRLKEINPSAEVAKLYTSFYNETPLAKCKGNPTTSPTLEYANYSLHRIISAALLIDRIQVLSIETYRAHQHLLNKKYFIPLTLVIMGLCSRTFLTCKQWGVEIDDYYDLMIDWKQKFPTDTKNTSLSYSDIDKTTMKQARKKASGEFSQRRISEFKPVHLESGNVSADIRETFLDTSIEDTVSRIAKENGLKGDIAMEDYGEILTRDSTEPKMEGKPMDYGEIVLRDDTVAEEENIIKVISEPNSTSQENAHEMKQKTGMKRKSKDEDEPYVVVKDAVSIAEKQKKKKNSSDHIMDRPLTSSSDWLLVVKCPS
ncbi:hypothetical protein K450DRAFT_236018 [Umbelopsis ramanniana AG]|uniref:Nucleolus and neural progenitor protein-like N-terminal domain-containing protein n=1 Tax=Umbelopsis ramanniana AG TaxID=1314678 RepID=A0AAD5ECJ3_UMBRA|nr:uncharacterized protein K450DRAFT_236018 [Umbelopsis ramanniana AG]KAI8580797.1 hypothetical protein K450DRAFT_236018 [Umbelopsis ramanniana AG]